MNQTLQTMMDNRGLDAHQRIATGISAVINHRPSLLEGTLNIKRDSVPNDGKPFALEQNRVIQFSISEDIHDVTYKNGKTLDQIGDTIQKSGKNRKMHLAGATFDYKEIDPYEHTEQQYLLIPDTANSLARLTNAIIRERNMYVDASVLQAAIRDYDLYTRSPDGNASVTIANGLSIPSDMQIDLRGNANVSERYLSYNVLREIQVDVFEKLKTNEHRFLITSLAGLKSIRESFAQEAKVTLMSSLTENAQLGYGWSYATNVFNIPDLDITVIGIEMAVLRKAGLVNAANDELTSVVMTSSSVLRYKTEITNASWKTNSIGSRHLNTYDGYDIMHDNKDPINDSIQRWLTHARFHEVMHRGDNRSVYTIKHKVDPFGKIFVNSTTFENSSQAKGSVPKI